MCTQQLVFIYDVTDLRAPPTYCVSWMIMEGGSVPSAYVRLFPFEIPFLLYEFTQHFYRLLYQQYFFQQIANQTLGENHTSSACLTEDYVVNFTGKESFLSIQEKVNHLNMYTTVLGLALSAIVALPVMGPLTDIIGRKPIILTAVFGLILTAITQVVIIHFDLNVYYYLLSAVFFGGFGGYGTVLAVLIAAVHDVTPAWLFTVRISIIEACITTAKAISSLASNNWIQKTGCNFEPPAWLMLVVAAVAMISAVLMPETLSKETRTKNKNEHNRGFHKILNGFKLYTKPSFIGMSDYWQLCLVTVVLCLASLGVGANTNVINYYLHNKPLEWTYDQIGTYGVINAGCMGISLVVVLPILTLLKVSNYVICLLGVIAAIATNILIATTIKADWEMLTIGGVQGLLILAYPTMRSCISRLVGPESQGAAFSIATALQVLAFIISVVIATEVYRPQVDQKNNSGIIFWIMAGTWTIAIPLLLLLQFKSLHKKSRDETEAFQNRQKGYGSTIQS